ncbi:MAG TPA: ATP-binding cassette domain-containing protein [Xenococcaceae cyanobacterium]
MTSKKSAPKRQSILTIKNLNYSFGKKKLRKSILSNINLDIKSQEIVILTGPSGAGKTTLLTLIGGLRSFQEGSLKFLGQEICGANPDQLVQVRRRIGYIFQGYNLLDFLTAQQNVEIALELDKTLTPAQASLKAQAILKAVKLGEYCHSYPQNLSGGQKQRVAIARALVNHPKLILADEPTAALDSKTGRDVIHLMQHLASKQGSAILMVTHDNRILDIADRIIRIEDGKLL